MAEIGILRAVWISFRISLVKGKGLKLCSTLDDVYASLNSAAERLVVIEFYANTSDRCKLMFSRVEQIANNAPNVIFLKVDVDQNREAVKEFDIHPGNQNPQLPAFILMKNNQRVDEMFGETNAVKLKDLVEKHGAMIFGSKELQDTANYTLQALEAVMTGVFDLAEHLNQKTRDLSDSISNLDRDVNYISALALQYQGKVNFGTLKKSLTVEKLSYARPMAERKYDQNLDERYQRLQINYNELDHVGNAYVPNRSKRDSIDSAM
jgi:thioredoxin 1